MQANSSRVVTRIEANPILSRTSTEFVKKKVAAYCRVSTDSEDQLAIQKQIDNYYDQMGTLVERSASTSGDTDLYDREIKKLCDKIEALRETLKTEQSKSVMTEEVKASIDRILGYLSKTDERSFLTYDDVTVRRLVECIVVHPEGKISVTLKGGFRGEETI